MKRTTIKYRSAVSLRREADAKNLSRFLTDLRIKGKSDEQIAVDLGVSSNTISTWRSKVRFPKAITIRGIEAKYGVKIL